MREPSTLRSQDSFKMLETASGASCLSGALSPETSFRGTIFCLETALKQSAEGHQPRNLDSLHLDPLHFSTPASATHLKQQPNSHTLVLTPLPPQICSGSEDSIKMLEDVLLCLITRTRFSGALFFAPRRPSGRASKFLTCCI